MSVAVVGEGDYISSRADVLIATRECEDYATIWTYSVRQQMMDKVAMAVISMFFGIIISIVLL